MSNNKNQSPTAQSGPSDDVFPDYLMIRDCKIYDDMGGLGDDHVRRLITLGDSLPKSNKWDDYRVALAAAATFLAETYGQQPPAGARDAVTDQFVAECGEAYFFVKGMSWDKESMRAAIEFALTGKADDAQPAAPGAREYDRELIADMLEVYGSYGSSEHSTTMIKGQADLLRGEAITDQVRRLDNAGLADNEGEGK